MGGVAANAPHSLTKQECGQAEKAHIAGHVSDGRQNGAGGDASHADHDGHKHGLSGRFLDGALEQIDDTGCLKSARQVYTQLHRALARAEEHRIEDILALVPTGPAHHRVVCLLAVSRRRTSCVEPPCKIWLIIR